MTPSQKQKLTDLIIVGGLAAFAIYKYTKLTQAEKTKIADDVRETGRNIIKELIPEEIKGFIPGIK